MHRADTGVGVVGETEEDGSFTDCTSGVRESSTPPSAVVVPALAVHRRRPRSTQVRHGQPSCADYGCTRTACLAAARKARRERTRDRSEGRGARVDPTQAAEHAARLRERGMSAQDMASASGVSATLVRRLLKPAGERPVSIARITSEAVLGVRLSPGRRAVAMAGRGLAVATTAAGMLTDLAAQGWPASHLSRTLGINARSVSAIREGRRERISIAIDQRIRRTHAVLLDVDPVAAGVPAADAARPRTWAARREGDRTTTR
jgi:transcriptional regulator with XRE-family HTH domain